MIHYFIIGFAVTGVFVIALTLWARFCTRVKGKHSFTTKEIRERVQKQEEK
jgi:hypothetical protein